MKQADCPRCGGAGFALVPQVPQSSTSKQNFARESCPDCDGTGVDPFVMRVFRDQVSVAAAGAAFGSGFTDLEVIPEIIEFADLLTAARYPRKVQP